MPSGMESSGARAWDRKHRVCTNVAEIGSGEVGNGPERWTVPATGCAASPSTKCYHRALLGI